MHRPLVLLLVLALMAMSGVASALHTHAYDDHDHPEHRHGLSAHGHQALAGPSDDGAARLDGCDPEMHTVSVTFVCAAPPQVDATDALLPLPALSAPRLRIERAVRHTDTRVHGPPPRTHSSPRAPPVIAHA